MRIIAHKFKLHKAGNRAEEYEDAMHGGKVMLGGVPHYRFAVADGATESPFSGLWAKILVHALTDGVFDEGMSESDLLTLRRQWEGQIPSSAMPWYMEEKLREGSYAALAGLILVPKQGHPDCGIARLRTVGDCCIFQIRRKGMRSFPLTKSSEFNSRPQLLGTAHRALPPGSLLTREWEWKVGDTFLMMTDALAAWFLQKKESGDPAPWEWFDGAPNSDKEMRWFEEAVESERGEGRLKNDDVTLLKICIAK